MLPRTQTALGSQRHVLSKYHAVDNVNYPRRKTINLKRPPFAQKQSCSWVWWRIIQTIRLNCPITHAKCFSPDYNSILIENYYLKHAIALPRHSNWPNNLKI